MSMKFETRAWLEEKAGVSTKFVWVNGFSFPNIRAVHEEDKTERKEHLSICGP